MLSATSRLLPARLNRFIASESLLLATLLSLLSFILKHMSKKSRRAARRKRKLRTRQKADKSLFVKFWRRIKPKLTIKRVIEVIITLIGVVSAYIGILGFWMPRIYVQPLEALNPRDALSSEFSVTN